MKRFISLAFMVLFSLSLAACGRTDDTIDETPIDTSTPEQTPLTTPDVTETPDSTLTPDPTITPDPTPDPTLTPDLGEAVLVYQTGFEDATSKGAYATGTITADGKDWELSEALRGNLDNDKTVGEWAIRGRAEGHAKILQTFDNLAKIEFMYAHYGSLTAGELSVEISADGGTSWVAVWTMPAGTYASLQHVDITLDYDAIAGINLGDSIMVRWVFGGPSGNDSRMNLDEVKIHVYGE